MASNPQGQPTPTRAIRLIFEYDGDQVRLVSQQEVEMAVTGFDLMTTSQPGFFVDSRDAAGATLARVPAPHAFAGSAEVFPEQPGAPIVRVDVPHPTGAFTVVVPAPPAARQFTIVRVAPPRPGVTPPSAAATTPTPGAVQVTDIATFPLQLGP